ncbi:MAG: co-chaperone GroES [Candidatus Woesearchaeota archaeon]
MKLRPIGNRVVVKPKKVEEKTKSGIYIPESAQEKNQEGKVVALGTAEKIPVNVGDHILYEKYSGTEITVDDEKYLIIEVKDIIGLLED